MFYDSAQARSCLTKLPTVYLSMKILKTFVRRKYHIQYDPFREIRGEIDNHQNKANLLYENSNQNPPELQVDYRRN